MYYQLPLIYNVFIVFITNDFRAGEKNEQIGKGYRGISRAFGVHWG